MEKNAVQRLARLLRVMVSVLIVCNGVGLFFVPAMTHTSPWEFFPYLENNLLTFFHARPLGEDDIFIPSVFYVLACWGEVLTHPWSNVVWLLYTGFLFFCGCCSLIILRQARRILDTVLEGNPFQMSNARSMKRAAVCCWCISALALVRLIGELFRHKSTAPLYTYNTLFVVVFYMGGLLFLVMSALFRQAAELKEDQDLTI
ncbi:MAG: DUF2975 domain-containing protein [Lawsonibacter sp.]|nr:DUF2975 domain-containing protein [Lawsonibacter sp.]